MVFPNLSLSNLLQLVVGTALLYVVYFLHWQLTVGLNRRRMIKENGCKPIKRHPDFHSFSERLLGFKLVLENIEAFKEHSLLETSRVRFQKYGNTFGSKTLGRKNIATIEPEILKCMLATKFKDWNLPDRRKSAFLPLLGRGIFTSDGAAWQHSRDLLRPNFSRSQIGDLDTFEDHISKLIARIPRDGSTIDLQELFFRLTIDSATEFLFGESTESLAPSTSNTESVRFAEAFNRSQEYAGQAGRNGFLMKFYPQADYKKDVKYVHDFVDKFVQRGLQIRKSCELEERETKEEGRYVFLNELVKHTKDPIQIRSELLNVLLAGRDTTASLLSNTWFFLARRPDIWKTLQAEVHDLGNELPTFAQVKEMKYLRQVLNECKRASPFVECLY